MTMTDATPPERVVHVPADAQFFRVADAVCDDGEDLIAPVPIFAAQRGDVVVHGGLKVGIYLGGGTMRQQS
ncbi:hypothetical protein MAHJHV61_32930 [Mycobacterium avium subsp. hominissuis]|uniref:NlpC/P60 family protein n=1 Tax=Mycobacterium avium TaxID=1764 RepID=UPI0011535A47|nr:NlpC/P60 family protein [Mycobacterium avium]